MDIKRVFAHLLYPDWLVRKTFPAALRARIEAAVAESERHHSGEIRVRVEGALSPLALLRGVGARERALQVFSDLRVWDTAANNGVLIYLLLADRDVEIVADRGLNGRVTSAAWDAVCRDMEAHFMRGEYQTGTLSGIARVDELLCRHFPAGAVDVDELPNAPSLG